FPASAVTKVTDGDGNNITVAVDLLDNGVGSYRNYKTKENNWTLTPELYCSTWDAGEPLDWRRKYGWVGYCPDQRLPIGEEICGKCLRITNRRTWDYTTVRIVDQCRLKYRKIEVDYETVFKPLDTDGYARKIGQMWVEFHFVSCFQ
ncbi:unnamed protein product, partial [Linum perenne]